MATVLAWGLFIGIGVGGLAAIARLTVAAHRFGQRAMHLGPAMSMLWSTAACLLLGLGIWLPVVAVLSMRAAARGFPLRVG